MKHLKSLTIIFILSLLALGCSSGSGSGLVMPSMPGDDTASVRSSVDSVDYPFSVSDGENGYGMGVFGIYNLHVNAANLTADLTPIRNAALGEVYQTDITSFLGTLCANCLSISAVTLTEDEMVEIVFSLRHPIPIPEDVYDPKPGDRLDLHLFDVRGIIIAEGTRTFTNLKSDVNGDGMATEVIKCNPTLVNNPDGFTTFFDSYIDAKVVNTQANLHPYKLFFKDPKVGNYNPSVNADNGWITTAYPQGQNVFPQGSSTSEVAYVLDMSLNSTLDLVMVLDACYGFSGKFSIQYPDLGSRMNPRYFLPEFHRKEAWLTYAEVPNNTLAYNNPYGVATISVTIYDWQAGLTGAGPMNFETSPLTHLTQTSDVQDVYIYVPELISSPQKTFISKSGKGTWAEPYVYTFVLSNELNAQGGDYYGIVAVRDTLAGTNKGPKGIDRELGFVNITDFTNYCLFPIEVSAIAPNQMPIAMFITDPPFPQINSGETVTFDGTPSFDMDGNIVLYEWDFDFDGLLFLPEAEGPNPPPQMYVNSNPGLPAVYFALLRVTDDGDPPMQGMFGSEIIVLPNAPPVAIINVSPDNVFSECDLITLDASESYDDSAVVEYEWDFDYNPADPNFNIDATGAIIKRRFDPGRHNVLLRVKDDSVPPLENTTRVLLVSDPLSGNMGEVSFCDNYILNTEDSINSNTFSGGGQRNATLMQNGAVVVLWVDEGDVAGGPAIKYSASTDGGRSFIAPLTANSSYINANISTLRPTMISDNFNSLHLGYADSDGKYYYQKAGSSGVFSDPIEIGDGSIGYGGPALAADMSGNIYYFFTGVISGGNIPLKLARSTDGGTTFETPVTVAADAKNPAVATTTMGSVIVAYEGKNTSTGDNSDIFVTYQRSGTTFYPPVRVVDSGVNQGNSAMPSIVVSMSDTVHIAWQDSRRGDTSSEYDIYYAYSKTGLNFSTNLRVNDTNETTGNQTIQDYPSIGINMMDGLFISWRDYRDGSGGDVYFSVMAYPGMPFSPNVKINDDTASPSSVAQGPPSMVISPNGGVLIIWGDERNASSDLGTPLSGPSDIYYTFGKLF